MIGHLELPDGAYPANVAECYVSAGLDPTAGLWLPGESAPDSLIRYKHCGEFIVTLRLLADSRTNEARLVADPMLAPFRTDKAYVISIAHAISGHQVDEIWSTMKGESKYQMGNIAHATDFWTVYGEQCCPGLHYFKCLEPIYARMIYHHKLTLDEVRSVIGPGRRLTLYDSGGFDISFDETT